MLRAAIGYVLGFLSGLLAAAAAAFAFPDTRPTVIAFAALTFAGSVVFAHVHHVRMKNKYYDKFKGAEKWRI